MQGFCIWAKLLQSTHLICLLVIKLPTSHQQFKSLSERQRLTRNCYAEMLLISLSSEISLMMSCGHLGTKVSFCARNERHRKMGKWCYREKRIYLQGKNLSGMVSHTHTASHGLWPNTLVYLELRKLHFCPSTNANEIFNERQWGQYVNTNLTISLTKPQLIYK